MGKIVVVVGMKQEADIVAATHPHAAVVIGAGDGNLLASRLEAAIAAGADRVISVGICGALDPTLHVGDIVLGLLAIYQGSEIWCDGFWTQRIWRAMSATPSLQVRVIRKGWFTWSATAVARLADKAALRKATTADVVDEETFIVGSIAARHGLPWTALRVVCDPASFELPPGAEVPLTAAGADDMGAILRSIAGDIWQIPELLELAGLSATALGSLRAALGAESVLILEHKLWRELFEDGRSCAMALSASLRFQPMQSVLSHRRE